MILVKKINTGHDKICSNTVDFKQLYGRSSAVELLRIICIMMVLSLHITKDTVLSGVYEMATVNKYISYLTESLSIVAVNVFVIISGYFSVTSKKLNFRKIFELLFLVSFYGITIYLIKIGVSEESFALKELIRCVLPYFFDRCWFINMYVILMLVSPFLNVLLRYLSRNRYRLFLIIGIILFSIWPTFLPNPPSNDQGYGIITFVMMYSIAGYFRLHYEKKINPCIYASGYLVCSLLIFITLTIPIIDDPLGYNTIFNVCGAVCLFLCFKNIEFNSKTINYIAKA